MSEEKMILITKKIKNDNFSNYIIRVIYRLYGNERKAHTKMAR